MLKEGSSNQQISSTLLIFINNFLAIKLKYSSPVLYLMTKKTVFICTNFLTIVLIILLYTINAVQLEKKKKQRRFNTINGNLSTLLWTYASTKVQVFGFAFFFFFIIALLKWDGEKKTAWTRLFIYKEKKKLEQSRICKTMQLVICTLYLVA